MATVDVTVNGRHHTVQCGDGEEARVRKLAAYIDKRVSDLAKGQAQGGDTRLLLMASLLIADELSDAFDEIKRLQTALDQRVREVERTSAEAVERVARHLDAIAAELEKA
ncbi:MAG: cell division protein ZapA [Geminicoccales bacterium]